MSARLKTVAVLGVACVALTAIPGARAATPVVKGIAIRQYLVVGGHTPAMPSVRIGAMVRAKDGDEFVVGQRLAGKPKTYRIAFLVHRHGAKHWAEVTKGPKALTIYKYSRYSAQLSPNGKDVVIEVSSCAKGKLYVIDAPRKNFGAAPTIKLALSWRRHQPCQFYPSNNPFVSAAALPNHEVTLVVDRGGETDVTTGSAEAGFPAPTALDSDGKASEGAAITRDPATGELTIIGNDAGEGVYAWTKPSSGSWSGPTLILAPAPANIYEGDFGLAVAADGGHVHVWACREPEFGANPGDGDLAQSSTCGTVARNPAGTWGTLAAYPGVKFDDFLGDVALLINAKTEHLHVVWVATSHLTDERKVTGLKHSAYVDGEWAPATYLVKGQLEGPLSLALTTTGHPVVGFDVPPRPHGKSRVVQS